MTPTHKRKAWLVVYLFHSRPSFESGLITIHPIPHRRSEPFEAFFLIFLCILPVIPPSIALVILTSIPPEQKGSYIKFFEMPEQEENYITLVDTLAAARGEFY